MKPEVNSMVISQGVYLGSHGSPMQEQKSWENAVFLSHRARESRTAIWGVNVKENYRNLVIWSVINRNATCNMISFNVCSILFFVCSILMAIHCSYEFGSLLHIQWGYFSWWKILFKGIYLNVIFEHWSARVMRVNYISDTHPVISYTSNWRLL